MRIAWYDHGHIHQSAAIPDLPTHDEALFVFSEGVQHMKPNVIGCELWRIPVLHRLVDDGHDFVWLTKRDIMPSEDHDFDLQRLAGMYPEYEPFVRERDPMLGVPVWSIRQELNELYFKEQDERKAKGETETSAKMFESWVKNTQFGMPPEADVAVVVAMRANVATGFETGYFVLKYLEMGVPVVVYDQDRQMAGLVSAFRKADVEWPHPLVTLIGPYEEELKHGKPITIDYPYVRAFEKKPLPVDEKYGAVYVGNDYDRRKAMERLLMPLPSHGIPVTIYGKYDSEDAEQWKEAWPDVHFAGRIPSCRVPNVVAGGHFTVNVVKENYMKIGLLTLRTFDTNVYGTLQVGDRRVKRIGTYVPPDYLADSPGEALSIAKKITSLTDEQYVDELERQREMTRKNDLDHYMEVFYGALDVAMSKAGARA